MSNNKEKIKNSYKELVARIIGYFLKGSLILVPIVAAVGVIYWLYILASDAFKIDYPWLWIPLIMFCIIGVGVLVTKFGQTLFDTFQDWLEKIPFFKFIYVFARDVTEAFVGEKKKFSEAVVVDLGNDTFRVGFITRKNLETIDMADYCAVYFPMSFAISGEVRLVRRDRVRHIKEGESSDIMKFVMSGGISGLEEE